MVINISNGRVYPVRFFLISLTLIITPNCLAGHCTILNKKDEIAKSALDAKECKVLSDICEFLAMPHAIQELISGEYTPTLCQVIPAYEELLQSL